MDTIGVIAALPQESAALLRCLEGWKRTSIGCFHGAQFKLGPRSCRLLTSGMGLERAREGARVMLSETRPHLLVSFGIAGAVRPDLRIGDVVVAGRACLLDKGLAGGFRPLATLSEPAWDAAARALRPVGASLVAGTAVTTRGSQLVLQPDEEIDHPVLEMETYGIAQVAAAEAVPLVSIRAVSDGPEAPIPFDLETVLDEKYRLRVDRMLMTIVRNPEIIPRSMQMMRSARKAADHAAMAVIAALSQTAPVIAASATR